MSPVSPARSVGVVGSGPWVRQVILPALVRSPEVELAGIWARDRAAAAELAAAHGTVVAASTDALVAEVDVVAFGVPPDVQAPLAATAAEAGCHLLLEKPIARSVAAADRVRDAVAATGVRAGVHLSRLLDPAIGGWVEARADRRWSAASASVLNDALMTDNPFAKSPWRNEPEAPVWDLGPHVLSVVLPLLGRVEQVQAGWDGTSVRLRTVHEGGARGELVTGMRTDGRTELYRAGEGDADLLDAEQFDGVDTYERLVRIVLGDEPGRLADLVRDLTLSRHAVAVLAAAVTSLRSGERVRVTG